MAIDTSAFEVWKPEIYAWIQDEQDERKFGLYESIFTLKSTNRLQIPEVTYAGLPLMVEVGELGDAVDAESIEGYKTTYNVGVYRQKQVFSRLVMNTDQEDTIEQLSRDIVRSQKRSRENKIWSMIRKAFDAQTTYGDGVSLVSLSHPRKDGGTAQANTFADGVQKTVSYDAVKELQDQLIAITANNGNLMVSGAQGRNKVLIGSEYLREELFNIAGVEGPDYKPGTADNDMNYFRKGDKFDVLIVPDMNYEAAKLAGETGSVSKTSSSNYWDKMWGIVDVDLAKRYFKVYEQEGYPRFQDEERYANESMNFFGYDQFAFGATAYYPIVMSKGDNSTFSG